MASKLGKRKRRDHVDDSIVEEFSQDVANVQLYIVFRQHFEAKFEPLTEPSQEHRPEGLVQGIVSSDEDDLDWEGLSDQDTIAKVQIVEHTTIAGTKKVDLPKEELKGFMVRPPS